MKIPNTSEWAAIELYANDVVPEYNYIVIFMSKETRQSSLYMVFDDLDVWWIGNDTNKYNNLGVFDNFNKCSQYVLKHIMENYVENT